MMDYLTNVNLKIGECGNNTRLMMVPGHAGMINSMMPWRGSIQHKQLVLKHRYIVPIMAYMCENDSSGSVLSSDNGEVTFTYTLTQSDRERFVQGLDHTIQIMCGAGAREIHTVQTGIEPFVFGKDEEIRCDNPRFVSWREQVVQFGLPDHGVSVHYAPHPMGSW